MHTRSYVAKVVAVACSLVLTCGYIYYRSMSAANLESQASANFDARILGSKEAPEFNAPFAKDDGSGGTKANASAKQAKMMMGGTKSAVVFTLLDSPPAQRTAAQGSSASRP
jgi:hypothetical protein